VLSHLRGSPPYWAVFKKDVFAHVRQLGPPQLFLSLSVAEGELAEFLVTLKKEVDGEDVTPEEASVLDWGTKSRLVRSAPVSCARMFDQRVRAVMKTLFRQGRKGAFGVVEDFCYRVEFQQRGQWLFTA
jgi:hypothetical protein